MINAIEKSSDHFPALLKEIADLPKQLYVLGALPDDAVAKVAIVGTRKATAQGKFLARNVAEQLARRGMVIVSGLAMGIDTAAHEGALRAQGKTIAVLPCGLDSIYPRQNERLAREICKAGGALVSEYTPETQALQYRFLERNRIVSGLSIATIIIEAPSASGALVTARLAGEQGREVFVFPGPHNHPNYIGSHALIRDGARLVASVEHILEDLGFDTNASRESMSAVPESVFPDSGKERRIFEIIKEAGAPIRIDKIIELTKLESRVVNQTLTMLSLHNMIKEAEGGYTI